LTTLIIIIIIIIIIMIQPFQRYHWGPQFNMGHVICPPYAGT